MEKLVGVQTPHYAYNYGAQVQAFALMKAVKSLGYNVVFINKRPARLFPVKNSRKRLERFIEKKRAGKYFIEFEKTYLQPQTNLLLTYDDFDQIKDIHFFAIIVGSDQIWRADYLPSAFGYTNFLDYIDGESVRKISYAASFGKDECVLPEKDRMKIKKLLHDFFAISVREKSGINILREVFEVKGVNVLDPTLLFDQTFYLNEFKIKEKEPEYIVAYMLSMNKQKEMELKEISNRLNCKIKYILDPFSVRPFLHKFKFLFRNPPVVEWMSLIKNAKYVVTDSFHGMAFSIIFQKQFIVYKNKNGGTERYISLLQILSLEERLFDWDNKSEVVCKILSKKIDYNLVTNYLEKQKKSSWAFLSNSLQEFK